MPERTVHFYRIVDELGDELPHDFASHNVVGTLEALDPHAGDAHQTTSDGRRLFGRVLDNPPNGPHFLSLYEIRHSDLPSIERGGDIEDLDLVADAGLAEGIHACFFPRSVVGILYNHYGPRSNRLADYMNHKANLAPKIALQPLIRADVLAQLEDLKQINLLDLKVPVSEAALLQQNHRGLYSTIMSAQQLATSRSVVLALGLDRRNEDATNGVKRLIRSLVQRGRAGSFDRLKVRGVNRWTESSEMIDILAEKIAVKKEVRTRSDESRTVADDSAREAIGNAYAQSADAIDQSLGRVDD